MLEISTESKSHHVNTHRPFAHTHHYRAPTPSRMFWRKGREREREREFSIWWLSSSHSLQTLGYTDIYLRPIHSFIHSRGFLPFFILFASLPEQQSCVSNFSNFQFASRKARTAGECRQRHGLASCDVMIIRCASVGPFSSDLNSLSPHPTTR
jgi:hypothetical protein